MRSKMACWAIVAAAATACAQGDVTAGAASDADSLYAAYTVELDSALGRFNDIPVFAWDSIAGTWQRLSGSYVPVTVNDTTPTRYVKDMPSDRPMMLPTRVQGFTGGSGQSSPYSVAGRMPGSNPEVQWVFVVRQYSMKDTTDADFPQSGDIAVIGHHPRTGATAYLQFYDPAHPKSGAVVVSPFSPGGQAFWSPLRVQADSFTCQRCHSAGPFIHTAWANQVTIGDQAVVPSDPLGPFFFVNARAGQLFAGWDAALIASKGGGHLNQPQNVCTQCHRVAPDLIGLNENSTRYIGLDSAQRNSFAVRSDSFQTARYAAMHWMPVADPAMIDFYAGQAAIPPIAWRESYGQSAMQVNRLMRTPAQWKVALDSGLVADVPRPPLEHQAIVVARDGRDTVAAGQSLWVVDSRMRANTDARLESWRFFGAGASGTVTAAPVIYRRSPTNGGTVEYDVVFVGTPRRVDAAGGWLAVEDGAGFDLRLGDYLGVVFTNTGTASGGAPVPFSADGWATLTRPDGTTWLRDGSVTYRLATRGQPAVGAHLTFPIAGAGFFTYSLEFRNQL